PPRAGPVPPDGRARGAIDFSRGDATSSSRDEWQPPCFLMGTIEPGTIPWPPVWELLVAAPRHEGGKAHRDSSGHSTPRGYHRIEVSFPNRQLIMAGSGRPCQAFLGRDSQR